MNEPVHICDEEHCSCYARGHRDALVKVVEDLSREDPQPHYEAHGHERAALSDADLPKT